MKHAHPEHALGFLWNVIVWLIGRVKEHKSLVSQTCLENISKDNMEKNLDSLGILTGTKN